MRCQRPSPFPASDTEATVGAASRRKVGKISPARYQTGRITSNIGLVLESASATDFLWILASRILIKAAVAKNRVLSTAAV
jgi:hypothetical protein